MLECRVYLLDEDGRIREVPHIISCPHDEEAKQRARQLQGNRVAEVWEGKRSVIKLSAPQ
jgi:hypothetical protein